MVEQIRISPEEVRGYGNVLEEHELDDFTVNVSSLSKVSETVHGALTNTYKLLYSVYGLMFDFDKGAKQLYLQTNEANTLSLGFDTANKQLYLVDEEDTGFSLGFDEDTNELYISDAAPPVVHNYSLALDSESYTTSGSLSVSATLLDDGVAVEGATVSFTGGVSTVTATTDSSGVATATVTFSASGTLTASYSNVSDTATVTVGQTFDYLNDFSDATTVSDFANCNGNGSINKSISDGILTLTAANNGENSCYLTESYIEGDFRVTLKVTEYQYLGFKIGYNPDGNPTGTCAFDITWNYGWQLIKYTGVGYGKTTKKSLSQVNWGTTGTWVFEYVSKTMKVYLDGTLKATLDLTSYDAIEGYLEFGMCCNRNNKLDEIQIEQL